MQEIKRKLLKWYDKEGRDLPWRHTTDSYIVFLSELILQQTQVMRGMIYFETFIKRFPDWATLARARRASVLKAWSGLGYNRRAIFLHEASKYIVKHGVPNSYEEWLKIKGVGTYTAGALTVFSLRKKAYPIDTNIRRVIGRVFLKKAFSGMGDDKEIEEVLQKLMQGKRFYDIPQALFDLSTAYCQPKPACVACPLRNVCPMADDFLTGRIDHKVQKKPKEQKRLGKKYPDRIYRGRILKIIMHHDGIHTKDIGALIDTTYTKKDEEWIEKMLFRMKYDKLIRVNRNKWYLA